MPFLANRVHLRKIDQPLSCIHKNLLIHNTIHLQVLFESLKIVSFSFYRRMNDTKRSQYFQQPVWCPLKTNIIQWHGIKLTLPAVSKTQEWFTLTHDSEFLTKWYIDKHVENLSNMWYMLNNNEQNRTGLEHPKPRDGLCQINNSDILHVDSSLNHYVW